MTSQYTEKLFSYGTLQYETVQLETFGRKLHGSQDILIGYKLSQLQIEDPDVLAISGMSVHPALLYTGNQTDQVEGSVFDVSHQEILQADEYEVDDYRRIEVKLQSGINAWVYVATAT